MVPELKGGVKGGHALPVATQEPQPSLNLHQPGSTIDINDRAQWPKGLTNVGNTCYANATLQCLLSTALTHALLDPETVPLFRRYSSNPNLLAMGSGSVDSEDDVLAGNADPGEEDPEKNRKKEDERKRKEDEKRELHENCEWLTRELTRITQEYTSEQLPNAGTTGMSSVMGWLSQSSQPETVVDPGSITKHPDRLSRCLRPYQQEDAHEFLRALLGTLVMNGRNKQLSSLFDGLLESAVVCRTCGRTSLTRDRYMDLSLDINRPEIRTLDDALYGFTKSEILDGDNSVFCQKCDKKRSVTKGLRLATAPSILVCHLKRFAFNHYGRLIRLHKKVDFPMQLEIGEFMSNLNKATPPPYDLVGILVHQGQTCASGHYVSFVKKGGQWYRCNDSVVSKVDQATVFSQQAYILMYEVAEMRNECTPRNKLERPLSLPNLDVDQEAALAEDWDAQSVAKVSPDSEQSRASVERIMSMLAEAEGGISRFLSDMCCASEDGMNEPSTRKMKRRSRRKSNRSSTKSVSSGDSVGSKSTRSSSPEGLKIIEVERRNNNDSRAQTAPRQRTNSYDYGDQYNISSPHTTGSTRSERVRSKHKKSKRDRKSRARARSEHGGKRDLPPLPSGRSRHRRANSNGSERRRRRQTTYSF